MSTSSQITNLLQRIGSPVTDEDTKNLPSGLKQLAQGFGTLGGDILGIPAGAYNAVRHPYNSFIQPLQDIAGQSRGDFKSGHPILGALSAAESGLPVVGPIVNNLTNLARSGHYGQGLGHLASLLGTAALAPEAAGRELPEAYENLRPNDIINGPRELGDLPERFHGPLSAGDIVNSKFEPAGLPNYLQGDITHGHINSFPLADPTEVRSSDILRHGDEQRFGNDLNEHLFGRETGEGAGHDEGGGIGLEEPPRHNPLDDLLRDFYKKVNPEAEDNSGISPKDFPREASVELGRAQGSEQMPFGLDYTQGNGDPFHGHIMDKIMGQKENNFGDLRDNDLNNLLGYPESSMDADWKNYQQNPPDLLAPKADIAKLIELGWVKPKEVITKPELPSFRSGERNPFLYSLPEAITQSQQQR